MGFYIRKSISAGPFRFNLSKSGVGLSVGVKGLRIGTGPRGHYVHAGRGGLYYRSSIGKAGEERRAAPTEPSYSPTPRANEFYHPTVDMVEVESGNVMEMADSRFQTILDDLNGRNQKVRLTWIAAGLAGAIWLVSGFSGWIFAIGCLALAICAYVDSYRRASVVFYDVEGEVHDAYLQLVKAFEQLAACAAKWHVAAGGAVRDLETWKRNAGAAHLVQKSPTALAFKLPAVMKSNVTPPAAAVGKQWLYFLPDVVLFEHDSRFGAIAYSDLTITNQPSRFIEEGAVPNDAKIVDYTWRFVNKKGGPDRRFNDNRQLPICLYEAMHLTSPNGLNELLEFSKTDVASSFATAAKNMARAHRSKATPERTETPLFLSQSEPPRAASTTPSSKGKMGPVLWENVAVGMSVQEIQRAQPTAKSPAEIATLHDGSEAKLVLENHPSEGGCTNVLFYFRRGRLSQVTLAYGPRKTRAQAEALIASFTERYGRPAGVKLPDPASFVPTLQANWEDQLGVTIHIVWMKGITLNANYQFKSGAEGM